GFCTGDSLQLSVPGNYLSVLWSNGDTGTTTFVDAFGIYQAELVNLQGCRSTSDPLNIFEYPLPPKPALTPSGTATICEGETLRISVPDNFGAYAWSSGASTHYTDVSTAGSYAVEVTNSFACTNVSDTLLVNVLPAPPVPVITQNGDSLIAGPASGWQWYRNGTLLSGATNQSLVISASGTYQVEVTGTNGCTTISEPVFLVATSTGEARQQAATISVYPNPGHGQYTVAWEALPGTFQLSVRNVLGQSVVQRTIAHPGGLQQWPLDITGQPAGMYLLELEQGDTRKTFKIVYH
ncbi:MAG: T9SS type A sorting domain-containing protein, partial [Bacteroidota bacterium]